MCKMSTAKHQRDNRTSGSAKCSLLGFKPIMAGVQGQFLKPRGHPPKGGLLGRLIAFRLPTSSGNAMPRAVRPPTHRAARATAVSTVVAASLPYHPSRTSAPRPSEPAPARQAGFDVTAVLGGRTPPPLRSSRWGESPLYSGVVRVTEIRPATSAKSAIRGPYFGGNMPKKKAQSFCCKAPEGKKSPFGGVPGVTGVGPPPPMAGGGVRTTSSPIVQWGDTPPSCRLGLNLRHVGVRGITGGETVSVQDSTLNEATKLNLGSSGPILHGVVVLGVSSAMHCACCK